MLCSCCNQGFGNVRDRADVLEAAIGSLQTHSWQKRRTSAGVHELPAPRAPGVG